MTEAVRFDALNELHVGCHDWTGVFVPGKVNFSLAGRGAEIRSIPNDKILSPVGGRFENYGIWDDVTLTAHEPVYVKDLFIKPSVGNRELVVEYTVANESPVGADLELKATVEEGDMSVLELGPARLRVAAGQTTTHVLKAPWPNPHLWSHADPYLYQLRTALSTGDALRTRFGFREFWVDGPDFVLNGNKIHLLASAGSRGCTYGARWHPPPRTDQPGDIHLRGHRLE